MFTGGGALGSNDAGKVPEASRMGPAPDATFADALRSVVRRDICTAFGVPVALFAERGHGAGQHEARRRFWLGTMQPLAALLETECKAKLDSACKVSLKALRAADEDAGQGPWREGRKLRRCSASLAWDRAEALRRMGL